MRVLFFLLLAFSSLPCSFSYDGKMYACVDPLFSVVLSNNTLSHEFTSAEIIDNLTQEVSMGTYTMTFNDSTILTSSNTTTLSSLSFTGSTIILDTNTNSSTVTYPGNTLELTIYDDKDSSGDSVETELEQGSIIRQRDIGDPAIVDEVHTIEVKVKVGELTGAPSANYRNVLYLIIVCD